MKNKTHSILVVSSDRKIVRDCRDALSNQSFNIVVSSKIETGLTKFKRGNISAVLIDFDILRQNGLSKFGRFIDLAINEPIMLLIPHLAIKKCAAFLEIGANHYFIRENIPNLGDTFPALLKKVIFEKEKLDNFEAIQTELTETQNKYERAILGSNDGLWERNLQTEETYASQRWHEILGYAVGKFNNSFNNFYSLVHPDDRHLVDSRLRSQLKNKSSDIPEKKLTGDIEIRLKHKQGHYVWCRSRSQVFTDEKGYPEFTAGSLSDITDKKNQGNSNPRPPCRTQIKN